MGAPHPFHAGCDAGKLTSVYERLVKLGVETREIKEMVDKVVGTTVESSPDAAACLMEWAYYYDSRRMGLLGWGMNCC